MGRQCAGCTDSAGCTAGTAIERQSSAVSEAIEKVRQSFAPKYEAVQKDCSHPESFLAALRAPQGLLYVQFCKECGWEMGRE